MQKYRLILRYKYLTNILCFYFREFAPAVSIFISLILVIYIVLISVYFCININLLHNEAITILAKTELSKIKLKTTY